MRDILYDQGRMYLFEMHAKFCIARHRRFFVRLHYSIQVDLKKRARLVLLNQFYEKNLFDLV